ncbi:unnamed protein product [Blepharisma stoltei]|uniref:Uncharacterized protein n=1 Tax=Blepharisma stoltei TaxID=1481888 RepID=A0AAU9JRC3_9CILI|nr:unnamed protein product [Blepharisma stoltei]
MNFINSDIIEEEPLPAPVPSPKPLLEEFGTKIKQMHLKSLKKERNIKKVKGHFENQMSPDTLSKLNRIQKQLAHKRNSSSDITDDLENITKVFSSPAGRFEENEKWGEGIDEGKLEIQKPRSINISISLSRINSNSMIILNEDLGKNYRFKRNPIKLSMMAHNIREKLLKPGEESKIKSISIWPDQTPLKIIKHKYTKTHHTARDIASPIAKGKLTAKMIMKQKRDWSRSALDNVCIL